MKRRDLIPTLILVALGWNLGLAVSYAYHQQPAYDRQPIVVCYRTDGTTITTAYVDTGATSYYPIESHASVEATEDGFVSRQETWFERMEFQSRIALVMR